MTGKSGTRVARIDRGTLRNPRRTPQGTLRVDAVFTRTGVFEYLNPDGTRRREYRPPEEVFAVESLRSHELAPVTNEHPGSLLTPETAPAHARGYSQEGVRRDGDLVVGSLHVTDPALIAEMESGKTGISLGYEVELDATPGERDGMRWDAVQRKITGNHIAIVHNPRAGEVARARMDAAIQCEANMPGDQNRYKKDTIEQRGEKWVVLSEEGDVLGEFASEEEAKASLAKKEDGRGDPKRSDRKQDPGHSVARGATSATLRGNMPNTPTQEDLAAALAQVTVQTARADAFEKQLVAERARADATAGELDALKARAAELEKLREDAASVDGLQKQVNQLKAKLDAEKARADAAEAPERLQKAIKNRVDILTKAGLVLDGVRRLDDMTDREIMIAALEKLQPGQVDEKQSDDYLRARLDSAITHFVNGEQALVKIRDEVRTEDRRDSRSAREKMISANRNLSAQS